MKKGKALASVIALILTLGMLLAACGGQSGSTSTGGGAAPSTAGNSQADPSGTPAAAKDTIRISIYAEPTSLDPHIGEDTNSQRVHKNIFDTLVALNGDMEYVPALAESWTISDDGLTYVFNLRQGVKAHNGEELTSEDVKYSLERGAASPAVEKAFRSIESIETPDEYTVQLNLSYVSPVTLGYLSSPSAAILNKTAAEAAGDDFGKQPVGYGAYQFESWESGTKVVMKAFDDYYGGKAAIETAEFTFQADATSAAIALEKGEVDLLVEVSTSDVAHLKDLDGVNVYEGPSFIGYLFHFNTQRAPFNDVKVRQALNYAVDKQAIIDAAVDGIGGTVMESYIPEQSLGQASNISSYPYDPDQAKNLLTEAGYGEGFTFTVKTQQGVNDKIAQIVQAYLAQVGVTMEIELLEWGSLLSVVNNDDFDATIMRIVAMIPDPDLSLYTRFHSTEANNFSNYVDSEMDALLDAARTCPDPAERTEMYLEINQYLYDEMPVIPMFYKTIIDAASSDLKGYHTDPRNFITLHELSW